MGSLLRIGNAQAFWGDSPGAPAELIRQQPNLDFLTLDYLAEVSLSILAAQREEDAGAGYARDFIDVIRSLAPAWKAGSKVRVVTNAGGLNPAACARACRSALKAAGLGRLKVFAVSGDDVLQSIHPTNKSFNHLETGESIITVADRLVTANAYLGARRISEAILRGADVVVTGRVTDPSLTVGPCAAHFGWKWKDDERLAAATVAGHLIECGTQVTGGISTDWLKVKKPESIGFPVIEMSSGGGFVITKPARTGGEVSLRTVKEQLLYEIGDPDQVLGPDVTVSLLGVKLSPAGKDRVRVRGARGKPPTDYYKVSATYRDGYKAQGSLVIFGRDAAAKAKRAGNAILKRLERMGVSPRRSLVECLGGKPDESAATEVILRVSVADERRERVERFSKELMSLITAGPPGTTGYAAGRPRIQEVFGYWPCLIAKEAVSAVAEEIP